MSAKSDVAICEIGVVFLVMQVMVNGEPRELPEGTSVTALLETLRIAAERVVVEVNLKILKRAELAGRALQEGDQVEIVHFVGGGSLESAECGMRNAEWRKTS